MFAIGGGRNFDETPDFGYYCVGPCLYQTTFQHELGPVYSTVVLPHG